MTPERLVSLIAAHGTGFEILPGGSGKPEWTAVEAALAAQGIQERHWHALLFTYAGDESVRYRLSAALWEWALEQREREGWPRRVKTQGGVERQYLKDLCDMWLCEVRAPWRFARKPNEPNVRRIVLDVAEHTWRRQLSKVYEAIGEEYVNWLHAGRRKMRPRIVALD